MATLESPTGAEELYRYRGPVPVTRPIFQGDVFTGVELPGFPTPQRVAIVTHPCTMRREGSELRDRLVVAHVTQTDSPVGLPWRGHFRVMPLPEIEPGDDSWQIDFDEIHTVPLVNLSTEQRIARDRKSVG